MIFHTVYLDPTLIPADETFSYDIVQKMKEVYRQVQDLRLVGVNDWVLKQYLFPPKNLSRMVITENYDIILPDYHDMTIKMEPLVKAVYILFCVMRRESFSNACRIIGRAICYLCGYSQEIEQQRGTSFGRGRRFARASKPLTNPLSNSINEKCARIRQAFTLQFDESLAGSYFIEMAIVANPRRYHWIENLWSGNKTEILLVAHRNKEDCFIPSTPKQDTGILPSTLFGLLIMIQYSPGFSMSASIRREEVPYFFASKNNSCLFLPPYVILPESSFCLARKFCELSLRQT